MKAEIKQFLTSNEAVQIIKNESNQSDQIFFLRDAFMAKYNVDFEDDEVLDVFDQMAEIHTAKKVYVPMFDMYIPTTSIIYKGL